MNRRAFSKGLIGVCGTGLLTGLYAWQMEPKWLEFVNHKLSIKNLPLKLKGKTLMQISDMHVGNRFDYNFLIESLKKAASYKPDFVVYTGDYVSYENDEQIKQLRTVLKSAVLGNIATVGILGNHDYGVNWSEDRVADLVTNELNNAGITLLRNEKQNVAGLTIIGLDDYWGTNFNPSSVLATIDASQANVVLCHNPDVCDLDIWKGYQGWILAGHTHGGQCKPPFLPPPLLPVKNKRYTEGEIDLEDGRHLYINRALGHLWQVRFNVRPEITLFELA